MWSISRITSCSLLFFAFISCTSGIITLESESDVSCQREKRFSKEEIKMAAEGACQSAQNVDQNPKGGCPRGGRCSKKNRKPRPIPYETYKGNIFGKTGGQTIILWPLSKKKNVADSIQYKAAVRWEADTGSCQGLGVLYWKNNNYQKCIPTNKKFQKMEGSQINLQGQRLPRF